MVLIRINGATAEDVEIADDPVTGVEVSQYCTVQEEAAVDRVPLDLDRKDANGDPLYYPLTAASLDIEGETVQLTSHKEVGAYLDRKHYIPDLGQSPFTWAREPLPGGMFIGFKRTIQARQTSVPKNLVLLVTSKQFATTVVKDEIKLIDSATGEEAKLFDGHQAIKGLTLEYGGKMFMDAHNMLAKDHLAMHLTLTDVTQKHGPNNMWPSNWAINLLFIDGSFQQSCNRFVWGQYMQDTPPEIEITVS